MRLFAPAPNEIAIGNAPSMVAKLVIIIGRKRETAESFTASKTFIPCSFLWLANSTIKIPFFVTNPIRTIIPISPKIFNV